MAAHVSSASDLIAAKGGSAAFARAIGREPGAVRMMKLRGALPRSAWPEIIEAFPDITLDDLKEIERASREAA